MIRRLLLALLGLLAEDDLLAFKSKLVRSVEKAQSNTELAATACAAPAAKALRKAKKRLQQGATAMSQYVRRLSGLAARKQLDEVLREMLIDAGDPIKGDLRTLRGKLQCPDAAEGAARRR
jgi:hypothetical protein